MHHFHITRADIARAERHLGRSPEGSAKGHSKMHQLREHAEVLGAAFVTGLAKGRFGALSVGPVPMELLGAGLLGTLAYTGYAGKYSESVANVASGMGAVYVGQLGAGLGDKMARSNDLVAWGQRMAGSLKETYSPKEVGELKAALTGNANFRVAGALGGRPRAGQRLTEAELRAMANAVR